MTHRKFSVTQADIDEAKRLALDPDVTRAKSCPVFQCLKREGAPVHSVWRERVWWDSEWEMWGMLSERTARAIKRYDDTGKMEPFSFLVAVPDGA